MSTIDEKIAALEEALAQGVTRVTIDGRSVEYRSVADLKEALAHFRTQKAQSSAAGRSRISYVDVGNRP